MLSISKPLSAGQARTYHARGLPRVSRTTGAATSRGITSGRDGSPASGDFREPAVDSRQHESVETGRIFAQLQESGMKTVRLEEIVRQKDLELKQTSRAAYAWRSWTCDCGLRPAGAHPRGHRPDERIAAIAKEYAKSPENTLVVSPDNRSRTEINQAIHTELQAKGVVGKEEPRPRFLSRVKTSPAQIACGALVTMRATFCATAEPLTRPASPKGVCASNTSRCTEQSAHRGTQRRR